MDVVSLSVVRWTTSVVMGQREFAETNDATFTENQMNVETKSRAENYQYVMMSDGYNCDKVCCVSTSRRLFKSDHYEI